MEEKMERLRSYDIASLQQKCHAFEKGCPFKHLVNEDFMRAVKQCPQFHDHCAFKDATTLAEIYEKLSQIPDPQCPSKNLRQLFTAMHYVSESLEQSRGDCPVFNSGCPFKTVESAGVTLVDPPESVSAGQKIKNDLMKFDISEMKQRCPTFKETCPYAKLCNEDVKNCPEFIHGCPFKSAKNLAEVYDLLSKIPVPHPPEGNILEAFKKIHTVSANEKSVFGECPVFHDENGKPSCPFKSVRNEGKHLVQPVKQVTQE